MLHLNKTFYIALYIYYILYIFIYIFLLFFIFLAFNPLNLISFFLLGINTLMTYYCLISTILLEVVPVFNILAAVLQEIPNF